MSRLTMTPAATRASHGRLLVDPAACDGVGLCSHLAPGVVDLDRWGYPVVPAGGLSKSEAAQARRAVRGCPRKALAVVVGEDRR